jgi:hypothetical protein
VAACGRLELRNARQRLWQQLGGDEGGAEEAGDVLAGRGVVVLLLDFCPLAR